MDRRTPTFAFGIVLATLLVVWTVVNLWVEANAPDVDIVARLDDVSPDGTVRSYNMHGQFRASRRLLAKAPYDNLGLPWHSHNIADARPLVPGTPVEIQFEMFPLSYIFKAGHRLQVTLFFADPNRSTAADAKTMVSVLLGSDRASFVTLPIIPAAGN